MLPLNIFMVQNGEDKIKMVRYIKCPRCDLNYINLDKQDYCDVCIAELRGNRLQFADLEDEVYDELETETETSELCPNCGQNRLRYGETVCEACRKESKFGEEEEDSDIEQDEEWKKYIDDDDESTDLTVDDETLEEELKEEMAQDEEVVENEDDFFDEDPLADLEDDDFVDSFDDDEEDDEEYEDEDDDF